MIKFLSLWGSFRLKEGMQARYGVFVAGRFTANEKPHQSAVLFLSCFSALITLIF